VQYRCRKHKCGRKYRERKMIIWLKIQIKLCLQVSLACSVMIPEQVKKMIRTKRLQSI